MKQTFIIVFIACFLHSSGQSKSNLLKDYFLGLPMLEKYDSVVKFLETSSSLGIDSTVENKGIYSSFKTPSVEFSKTIHLTKVLVNWGLYFETGSNGVADTIKSVLVTYYFKKGKKKKQENLYWKMVEDLSGFFNYSDYHNQKTKKALWRNS